MKLHNLGILFILCIFSSTSGLIHVPSEEGSLSALSFVDPYLHPTVVNGNIPNAQYVPPVSLKEVTPTAFQNSLHKLEDELNLVPSSTQIDAQSGTNFTRWMSWKWIALDRGH